MVSRRYAEAMVELALQDRPEHETAGKDVSGPPSRTGSASVTIAGRERCRLPAGGIQRTTPEWPSRMIQGRRLLPSSVHPHPSPSSLRMYCRSRLRCRPKLRAVTGRQERWQDSPATRHLAQTHVWHGRSRHHLWEEVRPHAPASGVGRTARAGDRVTTVGASRAGRDVASAPRCLGVGATATRIGPGVSAGLRLIGTGIVPPLPGAPARSGKPNSNGTSSSQTQGG